MLGTNNQLQQFNFQFAKLNVATDVLSFPADGAAPDGYLGDIVISVEMACLRKVSRTAAASAVRSAGRGSGSITPARKPIWTR